MRMDSREGQSLDLIELPIFSFHLHQLLMRPTLDQTSTPKTPAQPHIRQHMRMSRVGKRGKKWGANLAGAREHESVNVRLQDQIRVLYQMAEPVRDENPCPAFEVTQAGKDA